MLSRKKNSKANGKVALYSATQFIYIDLIGRLIVSELIAFLFIFTIKIQKLIHKVPQFSRILAGYSILLVGLIISDIYNGSVSSDYLRGWASIIFAMISTIFLVSQLIKSIQSVYIYLLISAFLAIFFTEGDLSIGENSNHFKVKYVPIFMPLIALFACYLWNIRLRLLAGLLILLGGVFFMAFDARSSGIGLVLASLLLFAQIYNIRPKFSQVIIGIMFIGVSSYGAYAYYVNQVIYHGVGGSNSQQLLRLDNPYNPFELLAEGRTSFFVALEAISDRPLVGFGSWAKDETGQYGLSFANLKGYEGSFEYRLGVIPAHSAILAAWVWGGVLGFLGMGMVGVAMTRLYFISFWEKTPLSPMLNIYFISLVWHFFFSPLGVVRVVFPFFLALLMASAIFVSMEKREN